MCSTGGLSGGSGGSLGGDIQHNCAMKIASKEEYVNAIATNVVASPKSSLFPTVALIICRPTCVAACHDS